MRVTICCSWSESIDKKYADSSKEVLEFLASNDCDLNWGSGSLSLMGLCYNVFKDHKRKIYGYTTPKYTYFLKDLDYATHEIYDTTFELKTHMFEDASFLLVLPGGTGTVSEFFTYLEEVRSNDKVKPLILYNAHHHFDKVISLIDDLVERKFNKPEIKDYFKVANNLEEFKTIYEQIKNSQP